MQTSLDLNWAYGFSKDITQSVHSLCTPERNAMFLLSSHTGVIYDFEHRKQTTLQGHCNIITCCAVDRTKRWIVTADAGLEPIMVVWDAYTYLPVKTFVNPHPYGVVALDLSTDGMFIATLSAVPPSHDGEIVEQELAIWAWTTEEEGPIQHATFTVPQGTGRSTGCYSVRFDSTNAYSLATTCTDSVYFWNWSEMTLEHYLGRISRVDIGHFSGELTSTVFLPGSDAALTATTHGHLLVWESRVTKRSDQNQDTAALNAVHGSTRHGLTDEKSSDAIKTAVKVLKLLECGINVMDVTSNHYLVVGCSDGAVRFYDFYLRLEAWFEDLQAGPVTSISFANVECPYPEHEAGSPGLRFWVPNFLVGTRRACVVGVESQLFEEIKKEDRRGLLLMQGLPDAVVTIATHPTLSRILFLCRNGTMQLWDYGVKLLICVRELSTATGGGRAGRESSVGAARDITFNPTGNMVAVSFSNGFIKLLNADDLSDIQTFSPSTDSILRVRFSPSGKYVAAFDDDHHVILFKKELPSGDNSEAVSRLNSSAGNSRSEAFHYIGRAKAHTEAIVDLSFGVRDRTETLISVSEDRYTVEFDITNSTIASGLLPVKTMLPGGRTTNAIRIETSATPVCLLWPPQREEDMDREEGAFVCVNSEFKMKEYWADSKKCRRTTLAPRFGHPPSHVTLVPHSTHYINLPTHPSPVFHATYAFATASRVIGIGHFPLDGNPSKSMGIVAHPGEITGMAVSNCGQFVFSAGGADLSVNQWTLTEPINPTNGLPTYIEEFGDITSYLSLLEGGPHGELHESIIDYFYYCQLRHGGEDTMESRELTGLIPLEEIPALMRSIGFYPTEEEVTNMIDEISEKQFSITGKKQEVIGLDELICLYVNHRPVVPLEKQLIDRAISTISKKLGYDGHSIPWQSLREALLNEGEGIDAADLDTYLSALIGEEAVFDEKQVIDAEVFSQKVLGFEDC